MGVFSLGLLPQALQRPDSTHLAWVSAVPFGLLPVALAELVRRRAPAMVRGSAPDIRSPCTGGRTVRPRPAPHVPHVRGRRGPDVRQASRVVRHGEQGPQLLLRPQGRGRRRERDASRRRTSIARPGDKLFVGTGDLRKTPYSEAFLYYLLPQTRPGTRYIEMDPGVANRDPTRVWPTTSRRPTSSSCRRSVTTGSSPTHRSTSAPTSPTRSCDETSAWSARGAKGCSATASMSSTSAAIAGSLAAVMRTMVVVPTYEEAGNITELLQRIRAAAPDVDVLVVDDNSPDGTAKLAQALNDELGHIDVLVRKEKAGLGTAYRAGFAIGIERGYDVILQMDADLSHDPASIPPLVGALTEDVGLVHRLSLRPRRPHPTLAVVPPIPVQVRQLVHTARARSQGSRSHVRVPCVEGQHAREHRATRPPTPRVTCSRWSSPTEWRSTARASPRSRSPSPIGCGARRRCREP